MSDNDTTLNMEYAIAIVGMACRFPGARTIAEFWDMLSQGKEAITTFTEEELRKSGIAPEDYTDPRYVRSGTILEDQDCFDASLFGYSAGEAALLDPQHRHFLECAWEALEDAGYPPERFNGPIGVFAGSSMSAYLFKNLHDRFDTYTQREPAEMLQIAVGNEPDYLATQVSYKLNLKGPGIAIQTACSTSLVAVHLACQSLLNGECDMALAGGVTLRVPQKQGYFYLEDGPFSPDGHCRAFDADANGTLFGQGVGIVALRRLDEALKAGDTIHAIIRGTAINNDGATKVGFTAPSIEGQVRVITEAIEIAGVDPQTISYVETHGTGTPIGDPIEFEALTRAFGKSESNKKWCALGSVKTNIGHAEAAAGIAGLIKTVLALKHQQLPPSLFFETLNPRISAERHPFYINTELRPWSRSQTPRRAGVSSFGFGGTNAHIVLEEAPILSQPQQELQYELVPLSARTPAALDRTTDHLAQALENSEVPISDIAYTLQIGRREFMARRFCVGTSTSECARLLHEEMPSQSFSGMAREQDAPVVFLFPGGGAQYVSMAQELYASEPVFKVEIDRCAELLLPHLHHDIRLDLYPQPEQVTQAKENLLSPAFALPALFITEYALARLWMSWGIQPAAMLGHSLGEYTAATLAGVLTLPDALKLVTMRARWMSEMAGGTMAVVPLPWDEVRPLVGDTLECAAINGPALCVVSGSEEAVKKLAHILVQQNVPVRRLHLNAGAHSQLVEPFMDTIQDFVRHLSLKSPAIPYISNVTGTWITEQQATSAEYWASHLRSTVQFSAGLHTLLASPYIFLEVGPGTTLSSLVRQQPQHRSAIDIIHSLRHPQADDADRKVMLTSLGRLWLTGKRVQWEALHSTSHRRISLPTYPFERERHWITPQSQSLKHAVHSLFQIPVWQESPLAHKEPKLAATSPWLIFGPDPILTPVLVERLRALEVPARIAALGEPLVENHEYVHFHTDSDEEYHRIFRYLKENGSLPRTIIFLHNRDQTQGNATNIHRGMERIENLVRLARTLASKQEVCRILVITVSAQQVESTDQSDPAQSSIQAVARVINQEFPLFTCQNIDVTLHSGSGQARVVKQLVEHIVREAAEETVQTEIAYRGRKRWVKTWRELAIHSSKGDFPLRPGGVYLITGGLGDMGLRLAQHFARIPGVRLALMSRYGLPAEETWTDVLTHETKHSQLSQRILAIQELRKMGADVLVVQADVSQRKELAAAIHQIQENFGALHGVIHAAGLIGDETFVPLTDLTISDLKAHFTPKAYGTLLLRELLRDVPLDFCILISSVAATVGGVGLAAYAAANRFLDSFAEAQDQASSTRWLTIAWDGWRLGKMGEDAPRARTLMRYALTTEQALTAFDSILAHLLNPRILDELQLIAVSPSNLAERTDLSMDRQDELEHIQEQKPADFYTRSIDPPQNELERTLCRVWGELLGVQEIGRYDDFFALGGHSLMATRLIGRLNENLGSTLRLRDLLKAPTVAALAKLLQETSGQPEHIFPPVLPQASGTNTLVEVPATSEVGTSSTALHDTFPLTSVQHAYWIGRSDAFELGNVACHVYFEFDCRDFDLKRYNQAWNHLITRHDMLRMVVTADGRQRILPEVPPYTIHVEDLSALAQEDANSRLLEIREELSHQVLNPEQWPLFEIRATSMSDRRLRIHLSLDVLLCDAASFSLLSRELATLYHNPDGELPPIHYSFREYVAAEQHLRSSSAFEEDARYWRERLEQFLPPQLPLQRSPASISQPRFERRTIRLQHERWQQLQERAARAGVTPTGVVLAAFADVLARWSRSAHFTLNLTLFNRRPIHPDVTRLVGDFTTLTLLDVDQRAGGTFYERARGLQEQLWEDLDHTLFNAIDVLRERSQQNDDHQIASMPVVFTSTLGVEDTLSGDAISYDWLGEQVFGCSQTPQVWLDHQIFEMNGDLVLNWDSVVDLFPPGLLDDMLEVYDIYLSQLAENDDAWNRLDTHLIPQRQVQWLAQVNATQKPVPAGLLHDDILIMAQTQPDAPAIISSHGTWTYRQLACWSRHIAALLQQQNVLPDQLVPVVMEKDVEQIIAVLAILQAGAAYLPIDASLPQERLHFLLANAEASVLLTQPWHKQTLAWPEAITILTVDVERYASDESTLLKPMPTEVMADNLAYVIYTSGSTGEPKGVMIEHRSALNTIRDIHHRFALTNHDRVLGLSALNFDLSVWDIFGVLGAGGTLLLPDAEGTRDPAHWLDLLQKAPVTVWNTVPALMEMLVEHLERFPIDRQNPYFLALRLVMLSGDWIPITLPDRIRALFPHAHIVSLGGATEAAIWSILYPIKRVEPAWKSIPYGKPMLNQHFAILNEALQPCPCWVTGKLYIGGIGLARGYWRDPEKTQARFIVHPVTGERLYDTGDLGRYLPDGNIEFLGREDLQIKVNGHRVELEEIEALLSKQSDISQAVVTALDAHSGNKHLIAYCVPAPVTTSGVQEGPIWNTLVEATEREMLTLAIPAAGPAVAATLQRLDTVLVYATCQALRDLGVFTQPEERFTADELMQRCSIHPRYHKWMQRNLRTLVERGYLQQEDTRYQARAPLPLASLQELWQAYREGAAHVQDPALLEMGWYENIVAEAPLYVTRLADVLTERLHSAEIYATEEMAQSYRFFHYCNLVAQYIVQSYVRQLPASKPLRILEIGAGFGTTTRFLLPVLPSEKTTFVYTDISHYFLEEARKHFAEYPFIEYTLLNIEQNPQAQGYDLHTFDIVVASSVLHATANITETIKHIRTVLAPGGLLLLLEETHFHKAFDLSMGLQQGFDRFEDSALRQEHPLLSREQWQAVLQEEGFVHTAVFNKPGSITEFFGFDIILAQGSENVRPLQVATLREFLEKRLPAYMVPARFILLEALPLTRNGKVDRQALPMPSALGVQRQYRQPRSLIEQQLAQVWSEIIHIEKIGLDDNFFRLGGDSLSAVRMVARIREMSSVDLSLRQIFALRTLESLAALVQALRGEQLSIEAPKITHDGNEQYAPFPLADLQEAYWIGQQNLYELSYTSAHFYIDFETGILDIPRLERALQRLIVHQPMLRSIILADGQQRILEQAPPYHIPVSHVSPAEEQQAIQNLRDSMIQNGPGNNTWPLFDLRVQLLNGDRTRVHLCCSLLIADGWSFYIFFYELFTLYADEQATLPELDITFRDYVLALKNLEQSERYQRAHAYWQERLPHLPEAPQLPLAHDPASLARPHMTRRSLTLDVRRWQTFKQHCSKKGLTVSAVLCTAYAEVLTAWSKEQHFTLNALYFNRLPLHTHLEQLLGPFSSTIPIEVNFTQPESFESRVRRLQIQFGEALEHGIYSGIKVLRDLARLRGDSSRPLLPVVFTSTVGFESEYKHIPTDAIQVRDVFERVQTPQVWLDQQALEEGDELLVNWDAVEEIFPDGLLDTMFQAYQQLLLNLVELPATWEESRQALLPEEQVRMRQMANSECRDTPELCLHDPFLYQLQGQGQRLAVVTTTQSFTYAEVDRLAETIAAMIQNLNCRRGELVAIVMEKGWEQIVSVLAIHKAGAAYLPIDAGLPPARLNYLLQNSNARVVLTQPGLKQTLSWPSGIQIIEVHSTFHLNSNDVRHEHVKAEADDLAYVIYTSGSTGDPKGVMITHRSALNTIIDINSRFSIGVGDSVLGISSLSFDLSVYDISGILAAGGTLVLPRPEDLRDPAAWLHLLRREHITIWNSAPALMEMLVDHLDMTGEQGTQEMRVIMLSGDWIPVSLPNRIRRHFPQARVISLGGATEAAIWSIYYPIDEVDPDWRSIPYGRPLANQTFHVLNAHLDPCPVWVPGELYIGGMGVAQGYWRDSLRTRERFIYHPTTGERLYRTGDLGRYLPDGTIEFLGREDNQVKIQGYRIELGEIETILEQHPAVHAAVVVAQSSGSTKRLIAAIIPARTSVREELLALLEDHMHQHLPAYMHPTAIQIKDQFPLTPNGKVDRAALARLFDNQPTGKSQRVSPRNEYERGLVEIWERLLAVHPVSVTESFFEYGGNSLLAVRLLGTIEQQFGARLPATTLFSKPTIEALAQVLQQSGTQEESDPTVLLRSGGNAQPVFCIHPSGGDVLCYMELARLLDKEHPVIALQDVFAGHERTNESITNMAARYRRAIQREQAHGPYLLCGWSLGGIIAHELACQLQRAGEEVQMLALIDSNAPSAIPPRPHSDSSLLIRYLCSLEAFLGRNILNRPEAELMELSPEECLLYVEQRLKQLGLLNPEAEHEEIVQRTRIFLTHIRTLLRHTPGIYHGEILLFRADRLSPANSRIGLGVDDAFADPYLGWGQHVYKEQITTIQVPAHHYTVLHRPSVEQIAHQLNQRLHIVRPS